VFAGEIAAAARVVTTRKREPGESIPADSGRVASMMMASSAPTGVGVNVSVCAAVVLDPIAKAVSAVGEIGLIGAEI